MKSYLSLLIICLFISCSDDNSTTEPQTDSDISNYIKEHNLNATKSNSGLYYVITKQGTGANPTSNSNVTVDYKGYFLNGKVFDQSGTSGISFNLQQVISGWTEGITYFKAGGEGILLIPYQLGYGLQSANGIPGGSALVFDIKLLEVK